MPAKSTEAASNNVNADSWLIADCHCQTNKAIPRVRKPGPYTEFMPALSSLSSMKDFWQAWHQGDAARGMRAVKEFRDIIIRPNHFPANRFSDYSCTIKFIEDLAKSKQLSINECLDRLDAQRYANIFSKSFNNNSLILNALQMF